MTEESMTFGLVGAPNKVYDITVVYKSSKTEPRKEKYRASGLDAVRKHILNQYGSIGHAIIKVSLGKKTLGKMEIGAGAPKWIADGKTRLVSRQGKPIDPKSKSMLKTDFTKFSAVGIPIYKIYYSAFTESYDVLGRKYNGEWVYGRDYDLKTGIWNGGRYNFDIDALYDRVNGPNGHVFINNRRGPTGRF